MTILEYNIYLTLLNKRNMMYDSMPSSNNDNYKLIITCWNTGLWNCMN